MTIRARNWRVTFKLPCALEGLEGVHRGAVPIAWRRVKSAPDSFRFLMPNARQHGSGFVRIRKLVASSPRMRSMKSPNRATAGRSIHD